jgi:hypothetical protein
MARPNMPDHVRRNFRIAELGRIFRSRYRGAPLPDDDGGWGDLKELLLAHASSARCTLEHLQKVAADWAPHFNGSTSKLIDEVLATPLRYRRRKAETVGKSLYLRFEERERLGIRTIRAFDKTQAEIEDIRHQRKMEAQRASRRAEGVRPREAYLAAHSISRTKPWEAEGISRRTWYRRHKHGGTSLKTHSKEQRVSLYPSSHLCHVTTSGG